MGKQPDTSAMQHKTRKGSVQSEFVRVREIAHNVLCLVSPTSPTQREYRAILEVCASNYTHRAEEEQDLIIAGYRALLKALAFPIQILVRSQEVSSRPYVQGLLETSATTLHDATWRELALSHAQYVRELAARRTLLEHRFYLILPADHRSDTKPHAWAGLLPLGNKGARNRAESLEHAQQQLDLRAEVMAQQLASFGLQCRRLSGYELAALYASCLTPDRAMRYPLPLQAFASVGQPTRVKQHRKTIISGTASAPGTVFPLQETGQAHRQREMPALPMPDLPPLADLLAPASVEVTRDAICLEGEYARALAVTCFPRQVSPGWLAPLLLHDDITEIVFHLHPQDNAAMLRQLLRRKNTYQSSRRVNLRRGRLDDPETQVAEQDVDGLISQLASGEERLFELGFYVIVRASDRRRLDERTDRMMAGLRNLFLVAHPTTYEQAPRFRAFLPEARDELRRTFTLDCRSLATAFPFISNSLFMPNGMLVGITPNGEPVGIDEWGEALDNPHEFCGAITGAGKSYFYKIRIMRELLLHRTRGLQVLVIDPEKEYEDLCSALGGDFVRLAPGSEQHLNPFDLLPSGPNLNAHLQDRTRGHRPAEKVHALHALFDIMLADRGPGGVTTLTAREKGLLDRTIYETYRQVGITPDPGTHGRQRTPLRALYDVLRSNVC